MPRLGEYKWLLDVAFFLYPTVQDAKQGTKAGGTGFLVAIPSEKSPNDYHHIYGVTNWHVAYGGAPVVRVNCQSGPPAMFDLKPSDWHCVADGYDVAVTPLDLNPQRHKVQALLGPSFFLTDKDVAEHDIGPGEDVFMLGRFVDCDGVVTNEPSMRFGHISIMKAPIRQSTGCVRPSYVVDLHSRTGYSGSPVFLYRTAGSIFARPGTLLGGGHLLKLLGVFWGYFQHAMDVTDAKDQSQVTTGHVKGLSGMSCVCPATAITEVLDLDELRDARREREKRITM